MSYVYVTGWGEGEGGILSAELHMIPTMIMLEHLPHGLTVALVPGSLLFVFWRSEPGTEASLTVYS